MDAGSPESRIRFGKFEVNLRSGELRKQGHRIRIQPQPMKVLAVLLERPGELVTRDELRKRLWPGELYVDFEHGLNRSINKLRRALLDEAISPLYIETLSTRGYRFIAPVEIDLPPAASPSTAMPPGTGAATLPAPSNWRRALITSAGVLTLVPLIFISAWHPSRPMAATSPVSHMLKRVPLVTFANGAQWLPAFSPDGSRIAYSWEAADGWHLEVKDVGTDTRLRLTQRGADFPPGPAWSPDGQQIAFARAGGDDRGIFIISSIGGPERKLHSLERWYVPQRLVSWSPNGRWIAFADDVRADANQVSHQRAIYLISPQTLETRQITQPPPGDYGDAAPAFSPDGSTIAFVRTKADSHDEINTVPAQGGAPRCLVKEGLWTNGLTWAADGKSIVFDRSLAGGFRLWRVSTMGEKPQPLEIPSNGENFLEPTMWRDRLAFESHEFMHTMGRVSLDGSSPQSPVTLVASTRVESAGRYSPDGQHIAFISNRTGTDELWMADSDGANCVQLTNFGTPLVFISWHPNGKSIAVSAWSGKVFVVSIETRTQGLLFQGAAFTDENAPNIAFSRDGNSVYVLSEAGPGDSYDLLKVPSSGGDAQKILSGRLTNFEESVDGTTLFYSRADGLWKRPLEGGAEQFVAPLSGLWDLHGDSIYVVSDSSIERYSVNGKHLQTVARLGNYALTTPLSMSPDARLALFGYTRSRTVEIDMVQGFN